MLTALTGYLVSCRLFVDLTACIASTTMFAKKSESEPMILLDIDVFAILIRDSRPRLSHFHADILIHILDSFSESKTISSNDSSRVYTVLHKFVGSSKKFRCKKDHGRCPISNFLVLLLC